MTILIVFRIMSRYQPVDYSFRQYFILLPDDDHMPETCCGIEYIIKEIEMMSRYIFIIYEFLHKLDVLILT
jgi:hypothetical protein